MNQTLQTQHRHRSIRSYTSEPVSAEMLNALVQSARCAPTSMNAQEILLSGIGRKFMHRVVSAKHPDKTDMFVPS